MIELLVLTIHITVAVGSLLLATLSMYRTYSDQLKRAQLSMKASWIGAALTTASGVLATFASHSSFGKLCISLFSFMIVIIAAQAYLSISLKRPLAE